MLSDFHAFVNFSGFLLLLLVELSCSQKRMISIFLNLPRLVLWPCTWLTLENAPHVLVKQTNKNLCVSSQNYFKYFTYGNQMCSFFLYQTILQFAVDINWVSSNSILKLLPRVSIQSHRLRAQSHKIMLLSSPQN